MKRWSLLIGAVLALGLTSGGCRRSVDASSGELAPAQDGPTPGGLERVLQHQLGRLALLPADLADHDATRSDFAAFREAVRRGDGEEARAPHARLLQHLPAVARDPRTNRAKLDRVRTLLASRRNRLPAARLKAMTSHLDALDAEVDATPDSASARKALSTLEHKLADTK